MNYLEQQEFESKILHLLRTQQTCRNIAESMLELGQKFGWLDGIKFGREITDNNSFVEEAKFREKIEAKKNRILNQFAGIFCRTM